MEKIIEKILSENRPEVFDNQMRNWAYREEQVVRMIKQAINEYEKLNQ